MLDIENTIKSLEVKLGENESLIIEASNAITQDRKLVAELKIKIDHIEA